MKNKELVEGITTRWLLCAYHRGYGSGGQQKKHEFVTIDYVYRMNSTAHTDYKVEYWKCLKCGNISAHMERGVYLDGRKIPSVEWRRLAHLTPSLLEPRS